MNEASRSPGPFSDVFPEIGAGGYGRRDGTVIFYTRVNALVGKDDVVLDLGAGRGEWLEDPVAYRRDLRRLQGKVARVIGADVDPVVTENPACDETVVMSSINEIPLDSASVDLIVSDHTLEHVADPGPWAAEVARVLKPGGWLTGRTPNRWGYIGLATNFVPNRLHTRVLHKAQPSRQDIDVFPTVYGLNTRRNLERHFPAPQWRNFSYAHNPEPAYFGTSSRMIRAMDHVLSRMPSAMGATWHVFLQKAPSGS